MRFLSFTNEGVLLYMSGRHGDYMGLYLRQGRLNYFIFNPSRLDKSLGGVHFCSEAAIELNKVYQVEFSFNQALPQAVSRRKFYSTALRLNGETVQLVDFYIDDLQFETPVYFGGGPSGLDLHVLDFEGRLTDIVINGQALNSVEFNKRVSGC
uniref:LAM_G_DOMAIN domain-containing protein n=1 Tax=Macrostomum lignano TaxID=282301 RepID=A0A1I8GJA0_9PLAT